MVVEQAWKHQHCIDGDETLVVDQVKRPKELMLKRLCTSRCPLLRSISTTTEDWSYPDVGSQL